MDTKVTTVVPKHAAKGMGSRRRVDDHCENHGALSAAAFVIFIQAATTFGVQTTG